jgi:hypothetical protein
MMQKQAAEAVYAALANLITAYCEAECGELGECGSCRLWKFDGWLFGIKGKDAA